MPMTLLTYFEEWYKYITTYTTSGIALLYYRPMTMLGPVPVAIDHCGGGGSTSHGEHTVQYVCTFYQV
jgi:hypothetical protein